MTIDPAFLDTGSLEELDVFVASLQHRLDIAPAASKKTGKTDKQGKLL